jgi:MFS family permease
MTTPPLESIPVDDSAKRLWRIQDFILLCLGRLSGTLGAQILSVAIGWQVYEITNDPFAIGLVGLCQFLPSILLVLFAGHLSDQMDRRLILGWTWMLAGFCALVLLITTALHMVTPLIIYMLAVLIGIVRIFGAPAGQALLPNVVPSELMSKAIALNSTAFQIATIAGPALAGALFFFGTVTVYIFSGVMLVTAGVVSLMIKTCTTGVKRPLTIENLVAGIHFIRQRPILLGAISLDLFAVLFAGVVALLPVYAKDILHVGPQGLGLLRAAPALGAAVMSLMLAKYSIKNNVGAWMLLSVVVFAIVTIVFGISENFILSLSMLLILGCADMVSVYVRTHLMQMNTPDDMRGRVASVNMLFITTSNELGDFQSGSFASMIGTIPTVIFGGVMAMVVAGFIAWRVPSLRRLKSFADVK